MKRPIIFFLCTSMLLFQFCNEALKKEEKKQELNEIKKYSGKKYRPEQPIKFSHKTHTTGFSNLDCKKCHTNYFPEDSIKPNSSIKNPLNDVEVKKIPYKHPENLGDVSDCARCHY